MGMMHGTVPGAQLKKHSINETSVLSCFLMSERGTEKPPESFCPIVPGAVWVLRT